MNYRIVRRRYERVVCGKKRVDYTYDIHEVYYDKKGKVVAFTVDSIGPFGENVQELRDDWLRFSDAFSKPILDYDKIPEDGRDKNDRLVKDKKPKKLHLYKPAKLSKLDEEVDRMLDELNEINRVYAEEEHNKEYVGVKKIDVLFKKSVTSRDKRTESLPIRKKK